MKEKFYIISPETKEEKDELEMLMKIRKYDYVLFTYKKNSKNKYINKLFELYAFLKFVKSLKKQYKDVKIIAVPSIKSRIASALLNIKLNFYMRGVYPNQENKSVLSDYIDFTLKRISINCKITNTYKADCHVITSIVTENFLKYREAVKNIKYIGPIWLKDVHIKHSKERRIFYVTQSFSEHRLQAAQDGQRIIIDKLIKILKSNNEELILKVHPRDLDMYQGYKIYNGDALSLLNNITDGDIIISAFSTLAFELSFIGANVKFVSYQGVDELYEPLYRKYNIKFTKLLNSINLSFLDEPKENYKIFSPINLDIEL